MVYPGLVTPAALFFLLFTEHYTDLPLCEYTLTITHYQQLPSFHSKIEELTRFAPALRMNATLY